MTARPVTARPMTPGVAEVAARLARLLPAEAPGLTAWQANVLADLYALGVTRAALRALTAAGRVVVSVRADAHGNPARYYRRVTPLEATP